jgi:hypothetical protein
MLTEVRQQIKKTGNISLSPIRQINTDVSEKAEHFFAFLQQ